MSDLYLMEKQLIEKVKEENEKKESESYLITLFIEQNLSTGRDRIVAAFRSRKKAIDYATSYIVKKDCLKELPFVLYKIKDQEVQI